jgi:uncharacterized phage protein (TIGR02220 family)
MSEKRYTVRLDERTQDALESLCAEHDRTASSMIRVLIQVAAGVADVGICSSVVRQRFVSGASDVRQTSAKRRTDDEQMTHGTDPATRAHTVSSEIKREEKKDPEPLAPLDISRPVAEHMSKRLGTTVRAAGKILRRKLHARMAEGYTLEDFLRVVDVKCDEWLADEKMCRYLTAETLFGPKFEKYVSQPAKAQSPEQEPKAKCPATGSFWDHPVPIP